MCIVMINLDELKKANYFIVKAVCDQREVNASSVFVSSAKA